MNTKTSMQGRISAFADGELSDAEIEAVLKDLHTPEGRAAWDNYHRIGDVLRSEDMDVTMSSGFAAKMAARLEAEPTVLAPAALKPEVKKQQGQLRRYAGPAFAAAAMAAAAFVVTPHVLKSMKEDIPTRSDAVVAAATQAVPHASVIAAAAPVTRGDVNGSSLKEAGLDEYVLAHQRISPSLETSAHHIVETSASGAGVK